MATGPDSPSWRPRRLAARAYRARKAGDPNALNPARMHLQWLTDPVLLELQQRALLYDKEPRGITRAAFCRTLLTEKHEVRAFSAYTAHHWINGVH